MAPEQNVTGSLHPACGDYLELGADTVRDQQSASGPSRMPKASTAKAAVQADALAGPPAASSATPTAHAPSADRLKPTVECIAMVAPRLAGSAAMVMPEVSAPEAAGTGSAEGSRRGSSTHGDWSESTPH